MVWIVAFSAAWASAFVMAIALTHIAARSDRPTVDQLAGPRTWLPPRADRGPLL